ncbi:hypothetical protein [Desertivirga brevis]|uniref:hypothetical protein n=1 Tax=Desertivirga brevis TaxID=2810310 RepID=UPI001A9604B4|nr:hypothetical protein [Pedobacter sp. SYSU D00873]
MHLQVLVIAKDIGIRWIAEGNLRASRPITTRISLFNYFLMTVGNWSSTQQGILNYSNPFKRVFIPREEISKIDSMEGSSVYRWMIHAAEMAEATLEDVQAFNFVFVYAMGLAGSDLSEAAFSMSLAKQKEVLSHKRINFLLDKKR